MLTPALTATPATAAAVMPEPTPAMALEPTAPPTLQPVPPPAPTVEPASAAPNGAPHQINLLDTGAPRRIDWLGSGVGLLALAATLGASALITGVLARTAAQADASAAADEQTLAALGAKAALAERSAPSPAAVELARLRAIDASQRRIRAALAPRLARDGGGYSEYLLALSRQGTAALWLTRFSIGADKRALQIGGRMTDPHQLPDYLRHLDAEPLFHGRDFAQLTLKAVEPGTPTGDGPVAAAGYVEFMLSSTTVAADAP